MSYPVRYMKESPKVRASVMRTIKSKLKSLDGNEFPNLCCHIQGDEGRMAVVSEIINELYSSVQTKGDEQIDEILTRLESTIKD